MCFSQNLDNLAIKLAKQYANSIYYKLSSKGVMDFINKDDIEGDLLCHYASIRDRIDENQKYAHYLNSSFSSLGKNIEKKAFTRFHNSFQQVNEAVIYNDYEDGEISNQEAVIVDNTTNPEQIFIENIDRKEMAKRIAVDKYRIRELCSKFNITYLPEDPKKSLLDVLYYTLNDDGLGDTEFDKLDKKLIEELIKYGEAEESESLYVKINDYKKSCVALEKVVLKLFNSEKLWKVNQIQRRLTELNIQFDPNTLNKIIQKFKVKDLLPKEERKKGIIQEIRKLFNKGEGLTSVPEISEKLNKLGYQFSAQTIKTQLYRLRKESGLVRQRTKNAR